MRFALFKNQHLEQYKIELIHEIFASNSFRPELKELYIPQKFLRYESLSPDCEKVCRRVNSSLSQLQTGEKLWIIGSPESGKSTLLKKVALRLAFDKNSAKIPVYLDLKNLTQNKYSLVEYIVKIFKNYDYPDPEKFIHKNLLAGNFVLLADGLDEIPQANEARGVLNVVAEFLNQYKQEDNTLLVACRTTRYCRFLEGMGTVFLSELNEKQVEQLIQSRLSWPTNPYHLLEELGKDIHLLRLARSPFGFSRICYLYQNGKPMPRNRSELYQTFIRHNLEIAANPFGRMLYSLKQRLQILEELAISLQAQRKVYFSRQEFCQSLQRVFPEQKIAAQEAEDLLKETFCPTGLVSFVKNQGDYRFAHLSLQEFLAAQNLVSRADGTKFILEKQNDPWWHECIVHYAGLLTNPSGLINCLSEINHNLALDCFCEAQQVYPELQKAMQKYLQQNLEHDDGESHHLDNLHQAYVAKADGRTIAFLKNKLYKSVEPWIKIRCAQLLCEIGDTRSLKVIEETLQNGSDWETKKCIVTAFDHLWSHHQPLPPSINNRQLLELAQNALSFIEAKN